MSQLIAKSWADEGFKVRLLADPAVVLEAEGLHLPEGLNVNVIENTDKVFHLVIPVKPENLSDEKLDAVTGGQMLTFISWRGM